MLTCLIVLRRRSSTTRRARAGAGGGRGRAGSPAAAGDRAGLSAAPLRVCYVFFCLLRSLALCCASSSRTVEGQEAQQRERGAADAGADGPAVIDVHGVAVPLTSSVSLVPPVSPRARTDRRAVWSGDSERRPARIFPPPPRGSHHHHTPARTLEGYSGVVLKTWGVKVVVAVCSGESSSSGGLL